MQSRNTTTSNLPGAVNPNHKSSGKEKHPRKGTEKVSTKLKVKPFLECAFKVLEHYKKPHEFLEFIVLCNSWLTTYPRSTEGHDLSNIVCSNDEIINLVIIPWIGMGSNTDEECFMIAEGFKEWHSDNGAEEFYKYLAAVHYGFMSAELYGIPGSTYMQHQITGLYVLGFICSMFRLAEE